MIKTSLLCHPATPGASPCSATVTVERQASGDLMLRYQLDSDLSMLAIPAATAPGAADGLWRHTCFEAFIADETPAYQEFNFSPSGQWAAYAFSRYREREVWTIGREPEIDIAQTSRQLLLTARLSAADLPSGRLHLGMTAVVETRDGALSYWALRHPGARPDFHDRAGFGIAL